ncbi:MAG: NAD-dependent epimerase/dehydratase family protein [Selenomonadaceae bacterium]|nr:NAD-dependent epimerase/dehydratase family protein [Selenomonadaceae bacterium]
MVELRDIEIVMGNPIDWNYFRGKTVLVTGATGRIGMYVVEALCAADIRWNLDMRIVAMARNSDKLRKVFGNTLQFPNVEATIQDIAEPIAIDTAADIIFHIAGAAAPKDFTDRPVETLWGHVQGTRNILEFARKQRSKQVFYVSTVEIYGELEKKGGLLETDMGILRHENARACYPEAKRLCETMLASYAEEFGVAYRGVRLSHTFGPGIALDDGRAFSEFLRNVIHGEDIVLHSDGSAIRPYTYVADAVGAMLLIATKGESNSFYNVANLANMICIKDLAELIAGLCPEKNIKVRLNHKETSVLKFLPFQLGVMNVDKVKRLGWSPQVDLKTAFRYTLDSLLQDMP